MSLKGIFFKLFSEAIDMRFKEKFVESAYTIKQMGFSFKNFLFKCVDGLLFCVNFKVQEFGLPGFVKSRGFQGFFIKFKMKKFWENIIDFTFFQKRKV